MIRYFLIAFLIAQTPIDVELERNKQLTIELEERMEEYGIIYSTYSSNNWNHLTGLGDTTRILNSTYLYTQQSYEDSLEN